MRGQGYPARPTNNKTLCSPHPRGAPPTERSRPSSLSVTAPGKSRHFTLYWNTTDRTDRQQDDDNNDQDVDLVQSHNPASFVDSALLTRALVSTEPSSRTDVSPKSLAHSATLTTAAAHAAAFGTPTPKSPHPLSPSSHPDYARNPKRTTRGRPQDSSLCSQPPGVVVVVKTGLDLGP